MNIMLSNFSNSSLDLTYQQRRQFCNEQRRIDVLEMKILRSRIYLCNLIDHVGCSIQACELM